MVLNEENLLKDPPKIIQYKKNIYILYKTSKIPNPAPMSMITCLFNHSLINVCVRIIWLSPSSF